MSEYLCDGAAIWCDKGSKILPLKVTHGGGSSTLGVAPATEDDSEAEVNIPYFGDCECEGKPCEECMELLGKWANTSIGGGTLELDGVTAMLAEGSLLICGKGGMIKPLTSGQGEAIMHADFMEFMKYLLNFLPYNCSMSLICKMFGADPVDLTTGNFTYHKADLKIHGELPLEFSRNYYSLKMRKGVLGTGWSHNYEMSLDWKKKNQVSVITEEGNEILYQEDLAGNLTGIRGEVETLEKQKNLYVYTDRDDLRSYFTKEGRLLRQKNRKGNSREFAYNDQGLLSEVCNNSGGCLFYEYNEAGQLIYVTDHTGRKVSLIHSYGHLIEVTNALGETYQYGYNSNKDVTDIINPMGITVVKNTYNGVHQVIHQVLADESEFQFRYDLPNYRVYMKDRSGIVSTYQQDEKYQNLSASDIEGGEHKEYNQKGQITKYTDRNGNVTRYSYDHRGNQIQVIDAEKRKWEFAYTKDDQVRKVSLGGIQRYQMEYDENGDPVRISDALKRITNVRYSAERKPTLMTQPDGSEIRLTYDNRGNIVRLSTPAGATEYTYDALNRVIASKDGNGNETRFDYNAKDDLVEVMNAEGNRLAYTYNGVGKVTKATNYDGTVQEWEYDECSRPMLYRDALGRETKYWHNKLGKVSRVVLPDGAELNFDYDLKRRLTKETNGVGAARTYTYDANSNLTSVTDGEGNVTSYTYDGLNRLSKAEDPLKGVTCYGYDADGNLSEVTDPSGNISYMEYDEAGQLLKEIDVQGNATEYTYTSLGKVSSTRDAAGRVTQYEYLPGGILKGIIYPDGTKESYEYDGNGNLVKNTNKSGFVLNYVYDCLDRIIEIQGSEGERKSYTMKYLL